MYALAPAPGRATLSAVLSAGLVNIPVQLFTSTEETKVTRKEFFQGDASIPVGRKPIRTDTGDIIDSADVTRMAEASNGTWVVLTDDEITDATTVAKGVVEVISFVPVKDFGNYLTTGLYQMRPKAEKGKVNPAGARAFALLLAGMKQRKVGALVKLALRSSAARYALLTSGGDLLFIHNADGVRAALPLDEDYRFTKDEVAMATGLIDAFGIDSPKVVDETAPAVQAYVDAKAGGKPKVVKTGPDPTENLMDAFTASIEAAKAAKAAREAKGAA